MIQTTFPPELSKPHTRLGFKYRCHQKVLQTNLDRLISSPSGFQYVVDLSLCQLSPKAEPVAISSGGFGRLPAPHPGTFCCSKTLLLSGPVSVLSPPVPSGNLSTRTLLPSWKGPLYPVASVLGPSPLARGTRGCFLTPRGLCDHMHLRSTFQGLCVQSSLRLGPVESLLR